MSDDLIINALLTIDEKVARVVQDGHPLDRAAQKIVERRSEVRINLALTEAEWRLVAFALSVALQERESGR